MAGQMLDSKVPNGPLSTKWRDYRDHLKLVAPNNRRKFDVIVVGSGLAGASAAATLGEGGYNVKCFCYQDSPRRAHSIAAQGGINAAKNYRNDGDSVFRLFYDTVKGGDFRSREANVHRLAEVSVEIIDQAVAQGVPFAREYGGLLDNRSFGGAQVSRTFYARGQTGQQLLLGAYQALSRSIARGNVEMFPRTEMLDLVVEDGRARGARYLVRDLKTGEIRSYAAHAVVLATGGYSNVYYPVHHGDGVQRHRGLARAPARRVLREPLLHPDPSHVHPPVGRVPVEAHADERVAPERRPHLGADEGGRRAFGAGDPRRRAPTTTSRRATPASATSSRETSRRATRSRSSMRVGAWARSRTASSSTSPPRSTGSAAMPSRPSTETSSRCTSASRARAPTKRRCASTRHPTTPWADSG